MEVNVETKELKGPSYYQALLEQKFDTELTAEEFHRLLEGKMERARLYQKAQQKIQVLDFHGF